MKPGFYKNEFSRQVHGSKANADDEIIIVEIIKLLKSKEITVDRSQRILEDAKTILPLITKL